MVKNTKPAKTVVKDNSNKYYRIVGIVLLILSILLLIKSVGTIILALTWPRFYTGLQIVFERNIYQGIMYYVSFIIDIGLAIWVIQFSRMLIKEKYTKQLLYYIYALIAKQIIFFMLAICFAQYADCVGDALAAIIIYLIFVSSDNVISRFFQNKPLNR